jgi:hypothetical protein
MKKALLIMGILIIPFQSNSQNDFIGKYSSSLSTYNFVSDILSAYLTSELTKSLNLNHSYTTDAREHAKNVEMREAYKAIDLMYVILDCYDKQKKYPETIPDGWHNVVVMNYSNICREGKALVNGDYITCYVVDNWHIHEIEKSSAIIKGKSTIELMKDKEQKEKKYKRKLDVYFMDYLLDPEVKTTPPLVPGKASFWADPKIDGGPIIIYLGLEYKGELNHMQESIPDCGQKNTLTFKEAHGTYEFRAYNDKNVWRGTIVVYPGECTLQILSESNTTVEGYK